MATAKGRLVCRFLCVAFDAYGYVNEEASGVIKANLLALENNNLRGLVNCKW